jgi:hypothetical protein
MNHTAAMMWLVKILGLINGNPVVYKEHLAYMTGNTSWPELIPRDLIP